MLSENKEWNTVDAHHSGRLNGRVKVIRLGPLKITDTEAKIVALAEIGMSCMQSAIVLGIDEHTVENHRTNLRKKVGKSRKDIAFDLLFVDYPPKKDE